MRKRCLETGNSQYVCVFSGVGLGDEGRLILENYPPPFADLNFLDVTSSHQCSQRFYFIAGSYFEKITHPKNNNKFDAHTKTQEKEDCGIKTDVIHSR